MKILKTQLIPFVVIVLLALPLSSNAGVKCIDVMNSDLLEDQSQDVTVAFFVNSQQQRDMADIHGNCAENPQKPGERPYDPITRLEKRLFDDIWDDGHSDDSRTPTPGLFFASSGGGGNDSNRDSDSDKGTKGNEFGDKDTPETPITPEPATLLIIGSALVAVPVIKRYRNKK